MGEALCVGVSRAVYYICTKIKNPYGIYMASLKTRPIQVLSPENLINVKY